ncbi:MAG TPA: hypothetical protein VE111_21615 [Bradyrhizobium sp.]|nr:hypothetical protein [Bradyrhizobium sp.]
MSIGSNLNKFAGITTTGTGIGTGVIGAGADTAGITATGIIATGIAATGEAAGGLIVLIVVRNRVFVACQQEEESL